ncbi:MAG: N-6 DNA methylase [Pseudomonadota bacterium]|nr:N-6 DNA methylase [Pseudomonadota bacterium]
MLVVEFGAALTDLDFEKRVPEVKGRIDALIGRTVFEAKSDLDREWGDVERRMPDYLADREREERQHFVGIASDGRKWAVFELSAGKLAKIKETVLNPDEAGVFLAWLDGVLALKSSLPPDALTIRSELGADSIAYRRVDAQMRVLWGRLQADRAVSLKRQLWAELLKLVYGREINSDELWFQHTFLVVVAKCIALAVMRMREDDPRRLLSGEAFVAAGIGGAVESDFFDWIVADAEGEQLVRSIMAHVRRFRLDEVESDVLKILYESLIDRDERHGLGEYYTPDWLAAKIVRATVERPLEQRVLDPACGSGTFLFHAIRHFLREAEEVGQAPGLRATEVCAHVAGVDIHPVAVIIARVTYLLALAPALATREGKVSIPVYLGDSMQLSISQLLGGKELVIRVPPPPAGEGQSGEKDRNGREQLDFPDTFCRDPALFDKAIERMRTGSEADMNRDQIEKALFRITEAHYREDVTPEQQLAIRDLGKTYLTFDRLRREGRDSVWAYVARNLSRPLAYSAAGGWAHVLVGNPPWVAYRNMTPELQKRFKELAKGERVYVGGKLATQNDLCALFTVRATMLYLRSGGRLGFVLPMAALTRGQFDPLRRGSFETSRIGWDAAWVMNDDVQPLFPVPSCAVFGRRTAVARPLPDKVRVYSGTLPLRDASEEIADKRLKVVDGEPALEVANFEGGSPYRKGFRQGATLVPRMLCLVERKLMGRLGADPSAPYVMSRRNSQEKRPWKDLPGVESRVEAEFLRPVLLGESILPYRVFRPVEGVIPVTTKGEVSDAEGAANRGYDGLHGWMRKAEAVWTKNAESGTMTLVQRWNYHNELGSQFPVAPLRVVYAASGTNPAACVLRDGVSVIEHKLYWGIASSEAEANYLCAILNSETSRKRVEAYQSRGQWGARDFDKVIFNLPIPRFDPKNKVHMALAKASAEAEDCAGAVALPEGVKFQRARALVRGALAEAGIAKRIDDLVSRLLDGATAP